MAVVHRIIAFLVLQPMFYGLGLLSSDRAFRVENRAKLIGISLEEGDVTSSLLSEENSNVKMLGGHSTMKTSWRRPPLLCNKKVVVPLLFDIRRLFACNHVVVFSSIRLTSGVSV